MRHKVAALTLMFALVFSFSATNTARADEYDMDDSDYLPRYIAYFFHPIGKAIEHAALRPFHRLLHKPGWGYWLGHDVTTGRGPHTTTEFVEVITVVEPDTGPTEEELARERELARARARNQALLDELEKLRQSLAELEQEKDQWGENVAVAVTSRGLEITITGDILFDSGMAELTPAGLELLGQVSETIKEKYPGHRLSIEGHTDNEPIDNSGWKSNWELGAARGLSVLHFLVDEMSFSPDKVSATTHGEFRTVMPNDSAENKARNRRAVIIIVPNGL